MKLLIILAITAIILLLGWIAFSYKEAQIEEPSYTILKKTSNYELRNYQPYIIATTSVTGTYKSSQYKAFHILADYIFGNNSSQTSMPMTAPVIGEKIAESLNQLLQSTELDNDTYTVSFVLPQKYTLQTVPQPNNPAITISQIPKQTIAVKQFSGYVTHNKIMQKINDLKKSLENDGYQIKGSAQIARYNPPFAFPLMMRNEIMIIVQPS